MACVRTTKNPLRSDSKRVCHFFDPECLRERAENGTRTRDLNLGKVALYQLSYFRMACFAIASAKVNKKSETPNFFCGFCGFFYCETGLNALI